MESCRTKRLQLERTTSQAVRLPLLKQIRSACRVLAMSSRPPESRMEELLRRAFYSEVLRKVTKTILPLNDAGSGPSFYYVHGLLGLATEFRDMVRMLGPNQNCYGVQASTEKRIARFGASIREMGKLYADELTRFQPMGAFVLGGYSMGATIALEVAQQLIAGGRAVSLLVVFDGEIYNTGAELTALNPTYWLKLMRNLPRWTADELIRNRLAAMRRLRMAVVASHPAEQFVNLNGLMPDHAAFVRSLYDAHGSYVPDIYPGRVLVFVSKTQPLFRLRQVESAWKKIAKNAEIVEVDSRHIELLKRPHGVPVAERLRTEIERLNNQLPIASRSRPAVGSFDQANDAAPLTMPPT